MSLPTNVKVLYVLSKFLTHSTGENRVGLSFYVVHERIILFWLTEELPKKDNFFIKKRTTANLPPLTLPRKVVQNTCGTVYVLPTRSTIFFNFNFFTIFTFY